MRKNKFGCRISCTGLDAEISHLEGNPDDVAEDGAMILDPEKFSQLRKDYKAFKSKLVRNIKFNARSPTLGKTHLENPDEIIFHSSLIKRRRDLLH